MKQIENVLEGTVAKVFELECKYSIISNRDKILRINNHPCTQLCDPFLYTWMKRCMWNKNLKGDKKGRNRD